MSTTQRAASTVICNYGECRQRGLKREFTDGKYCSTEHRDRDLGSDVLDAIRHDHTVCSTCYRWLKDIERPPESFGRGRADVIDEAVVGFQYDTEDYHQWSGEKFCTCGNVDHKSDNGFIKTSDLKATLVHLMVVIREHRADGRHDHSVDPDELLSALKAQDGDLDWEIAIGRAVE